MFIILMFLIVISFHEVNLLYDIKLTKKRYEEIKRIKGEMRQDKENKGRAKQDKKSESKRIRRYNIGSRFIKALSIFIFLLIGLVLFRSFVGDWYFMNNDLLKPYLIKGHYFFVEEINKSVKRGDIVITREEIKGPIVSIVIGLPGDIIELKSGTYFVNGKPLKSIHYSLGQPSGIGFEGQNYIVVPSDSFFGTPTYNSKRFLSVDISRFVHRKSDIIGKLFPLTNVYTK